MWNFSALAEEVRTDTRNLIWHEELKDFLAERGRGSYEWHEELKGLAVKIHVDVDTMAKKVKVLDTSGQGFQIRQGLFRYDPIQFKRDRGNLSALHRRVLKVRPRWADRNLTSLHPAYRCFTVWCHFKARKSEWKELPFGLRRTLQGIYDYKILG